MRNSIWCRGEDACRERKLLVELTNFKCGNPRCSHAPSAQMACVLWSQSSSCDDERGRCCFRREADACAPKPKCRDFRNLVVIVGKADMKRTSPDRLTHSGHLVQSRRHALRTSVL